MFVTSKWHVIFAHLSEWVAEDMSLFELQQVSAAYLFSSLVQKVEEGTFDLLRREYLLYIYHSGRNLYSMFVLYLSVPANIWRCVPKPDTELWL